MPFVDALSAAVSSAAQPPAFDSRATGRPSDFSGRDADWPLWCFVFEAHVAVLSPDEDLLTRCLVEAAEPKLTGMTEIVRGIAKKVYIMVVTAVKGKALGLLRGVEKFNGFAAWRALKNHYEPDLAGRHAGMLCGLLTPDWQTRHDTGADFVELLTSWETGIAQWE